MTNDNLSCNQPCDDFVCAECIDATMLCELGIPLSENGFCSFDKDHTAQPSQGFCLSKHIAKFDAYFRAHYVPGGESITFDNETDEVYHGQHGNTLEECIQECFLADVTLSEAIQNQLCDYGFCHDTFENFYDEHRCYETNEEASHRVRLEAADYEEWFSEGIDFKWKSFCESVKKHQRYFNLVDALNKIFGSKAQYDDALAENDSSCPIKTFKTNTTLYRARLFSDNQEAQKACCNLKEEFGPPPREKAAEGRMNSLNIPVFYGAFDETTSLNEVRPHIGATVGIAAFKLAKECSFFDFTIFDNQESDPLEYSRFDFIAELHALISKPVPPNPEPLEYLPTQILAEYLRHHFEIDGIIFRSSLSDNDDAKNVVVFDYAKLGVSTSTINLYQIQSVKYSVTDAKIVNSDDPYGLLMSEY